MNNFLSILKINSAIAVVCFAAAGCDAPIESFEPNQIFSKRMELNESIDMAKPLEDSHELLVQWFGTPDEPKWPAFLIDENGESVVDSDKLKQAAGAVSSDEDGRHKGLYREHCVVCHGINGSGQGPSASLLNPYPRDFRLGKVKFKSTPIGSKPIRSDIRKTLERGIVGTSMPSFGLLADEDIEALTDYFVYLSIRGEVERKLLLDAAIELDFDDGERLFDASLEQRNPEEFAEKLELLKGFASDVHDSWLDAGESETQIVAPPNGFPIFGRSENQADIEKSVAKGKKLFNGNVASCAFCHGPEAKGDGQPNNYDEWTRDWTVLAGLSPTKLEELEPMLDLGALKPRNAIPRNLTLGGFRGGSSPEELYLRIVNGIEGTPMPAAPVKPDNPQGLKNEEVWDLVNYLLSLGAVADAPDALTEGGDEA